jgi:hypothetical protein
MHLPCGQAAFAVWTGITNAAISCVNAAISRSNGGISIM